MPFIDYGILHYEPVAGAHAVHVGRPRSTKRRVLTSYNAQYIWTRITVRAVRLCDIIRWLEWTNLVLRIYHPITVLASIEYPHCVSDLPVHFTFMVMLPLPQFCALSESQLR